MHPTPTWSSKGNAAGLFGYQVRRIERTLETLSMTTRPFRSLLVFLAALPALLHAAEHRFTIDNPLNLDWPAELVYLDIPEADARGDWVAEYDGKTVPAQVEPGAAAAGKSRVWFIASLAMERTKGQPPGSLKVTIKPGKADSPLRVIDHADHLVIDNGIAAVRLPRPGERFAASRLADMPTLVTGVRLSGEDEFYGSGYFESDATVSNATVTIEQRGPVFVTARVEYQVAGDAPVDQRPHQPKRPGLFYEATLRFVANDPWIEIDEQYRLPAGSRYWLTFQGKQRFDTVFWIRWFGYEKFGGNIDVNYVPLEPQKMQRGPFVALRPRWNQMPGGGQDFFITRGGEPTRPKPEEEAKAYRPSPYDAAAPAVGVVAAFPSRWIDPFPQTISCFAENGDTARIRFPVESGRRAWALVVGPRGQFDTTGTLNGLVRRHADWTLNKQIHETILEWDRDPRKSGPRILITREQLERLADDWKAQRNTPETRLIREWEQEYRRLRAIVDEHAKLDRDAKNQKLPAADREVAAARAKEKSKEAGEARKKLESNDFLLLAAILGEPLPGAGSLPSPGLWLQRRYQDDFLNPTQATVRRLPAAFTRADLVAAGKPFGGADQAALAYIFADPDNWPGWMNGWTPGNPNFHTDKYMTVAFAAASMFDHPHAPRWLEWAKSQFDDDVARVILPSGVGYECPGYSGYSLNLQLELAHVFENTGFGHVVADNPLFGKTAEWHRHLLTPLDPRLGFRHEAPIGDTHRWTSGLGIGFGRIARAVREKNPKLAAELMAVLTMLEQQGGVAKRESLVAELLEVDRSIKPADLRSMDWSSQSFDGFGVVLRSRFNTDKETFLSLKADRTRGHYHNDEMSWHFYGAGLPVSLDYNCGYHPRGDHAALHNSMTFGRTVEDFKHVGEDKPVTAMEELSGVARVLAFAKSEAADAVVAEVNSDRLTLKALYPDEAKFQYNYPSRDAAVPISHRRFITLVKHPPGSPLNDYLVVRDDTRSRDAQQINLHLLTRELKQDGNTFRGVGQLDADVTLFFARLDLDRAEVRRWFYFDEWMRGPGQYGPRDSDENKAWAKRIEESDGRALIPPEGWKGPWQVGEYQQWLRLHTKPGSSAVYVIYPRRRGEPEPTFESLDDGHGVRVTLLGQADEVRVSGERGVAVTRAGVTTVLVEPGKLPPLGVEAAEPARD